jgi:hypothetical protein
MMEETSPRTSAKWRPRETFASTVVAMEGGKLEAGERKGSAF